MNFEFTTAGRIIFGPGTTVQVGNLARGLGRRAMVVGGKSPDRADIVVRALEAQGIHATRFQVETEPTVSMLTAGVELARCAQCDLVISIGGGSVIDSGKVIAALKTNPGDFDNYLEVIGRGQPIENPPAPHIALPTTAGTGAEVTRNSVLTSTRHKVKVSMRSPLMIPQIAIVDPELTYSMPPGITAATGLDAFTQLLEAFVSAGANPLTDGICREGLKRAADSLERVYLNGNDRQAREQMCLASLGGGLALANAKLGAVHGIAGPLGGMFAAPHGAVCGRLLPFVMAMNIEALKQRLPASPALPRYVETARIVTGNPGATALDGVTWVQNLCDRLQIPPLAASGVDGSAIADIIQNAQKASSMRGNPIALTADELHTVIRQAV